MVESQMSYILKELEGFFHCSLEPDKNNSCLIKMGIGLSLQIELDRQGYLLIGCKLGALYMGRYRSDLMRAALESNALTPLSTGVLGYSHKSSQLILFLRINQNETPMHEWIEQLPLFIEKAKLWTNAITKNEIPAIATPIKATSIFELMK